MSKKGATIISEYNELVSLLKGKSIQDIIDCPQIEIHQHESQCIMFCYKHLSGAIYDLDTNPFLYKGFSVWNYAYDDWDTIDFEKDVFLQEQKPQQSITGTNSTIVVMNYMTGEVDIYNNVKDGEFVGREEEWLIDNGYDQLGDIHYMIANNLSVNFYNH